MNEPDAPWLGDLSMPLLSAKKQLTQLADLEDQVNRHGKEEIRWDAKLNAAFEGFDRAQDLLADLSLAFAPKSEKIPIWTIAGGAPGPEITSLVAWEEAVKRLASADPAEVFLAPNADALTRPAVDDQRLEALQMLLDHTLKESQDRISKLKKYEGDCIEVSCTSVMSTSGKLSHERLKVVRVSNFAVGQGI